MATKHLATFDEYGFITLDEDLQHLVAGGGPLNVINHFCHSSSTLDAQCPTPKLNQRCDGNTVCFGNVSCQPNGICHDVIC